MVTGTRTVRDIATKALRKAGLVSIAEEPEAALMGAAAEELEAMLKAWQAQPWMWTRTRGTLTLTTSASYTLSPVRPVRILSARLKRNGIETPMQALSRAEYDELPQKLSTGLPTTFYYDRQREAALFYVWPVLAAATGETVDFTYVREIEDIGSLNDVIDVPGEWWDCVTLNLAARMAQELERANQAALLVPLARDALLTAAAMEMDESVTMEMGR